jgi:hypothetical protein
VAGRPAQRGGQADNEFRIQTRGVGGREILGAQDRWNVRQRDAGLGQAAELGDDAVADVPQIGDPLGHQAAELGEHVDELLGCCNHRRDGRCAVLDALLRGPQPGTVLRQRRGGGKHLRRGAGRVGGAVAKPVRDGTGGCRETRGLGRAVGFLYICLVGDVDHRRSARPDHRRVLDPGDHRDTVENRARCWQ